MKPHLIKGIKLTFFLILIFGIGYPLLINAIGMLMQEKSAGSPVTDSDGHVIGFRNIGQRFDDDRYFNSRPSAVNYDASSSGASNKGPANPEYLSEVSARIDTFIVHNPEIKRSEIPSELVTASGSGLDPDISLDAALIQIPRISKARNINSDILRKLVNENAVSGFAGVLGSKKINVLQLNILLDKIR